MRFVSIPYHEGAVCPAYVRLHSSVFSLLQKRVNVRVESRIVNGSKFQSEGPEVAKLRDPYPASRLSGIDKPWRAAELRYWQLAVDDMGMHMSARYDGAVQRRHLLTSVHSLYWIRCRTGQWTNKRRDKQKETNRQTNRRTAPSQKASLLWQGLRNS